MPMPWDRLIDALPLALAKPGTPEGAALLRGYMQSQERMRQADLQERQLSGQETFRQAQLSNMEADNARAEQQAVLDRLTRAQGALMPWAAQLGETATDPDAAQQQLATQASTMEQSFGVPSGQLAAMMPPLAPVISARKKRQAKELYDQAEKRFGPEAMATDSITLQSVQFGDVKPSALRQMFEAQALTAQGQPATPAMPSQRDGASDLDRSFQRARKAREAELGRPLTPAEDDILDRTIRREVLALGRSEGQAGLTPGMESNVLNRLTTQWTTATKPAVELQRQIKMMEAGLDAARRGDMAQGAQAVLVTFQKVLDPTSVVRESEYARSAAGLALDDRVRGAMERLARGGAGVPLEELEKFARVAHEAVQKQTSGYLDAVKARIGKTADRYKIPRDIVFEDFDFGTVGGTLAGARTRVIGPNGETGTVPAGTPLPPGWRATQ